MRILIADDNENTRKLIRMLVRDLAQTFYEARDGLEAIELYVRHRPDWVLMDIEMGRIDGISATRIIREIDASAKIIIVTMFDDPLLRSKSRHAGAAGYLSKKDLTGLPSMLV